MTTVPVMFIIVNIFNLIIVVQNKLTLEQVVILNRHSVRAPLSDNLNDVSPKIWPKWIEKPGFLTAKGSTLAGYMGHFLVDWLKTKEVLPLDCPNKDEFYVLSNHLERTLKSAQSFVDNGFPGCKIKIHQTCENSSDSIFNPVIRNTTAVFQEKAIEEMHEVLNSIQLNPAYELLSEILDYNGSIICEITKECNLAKVKHSVSVTPGQKPQLTGPLKISSEVIDNFLMQNYEGYSTENIAWGQLIDIDTWRTLLKLNTAYFNVKYKTKLVATDISKKMLNYITNIFVSEDNKPKVTLLVGHDINFYTLFVTLSVKPYCLQNQHEIIPIGGAVVFQKWRDDEYQQNYLKITYVYQSTEQLRQCTCLNKNSPPMFNILELEQCKVDVNGLCPWDDFMKILSRNIS